MRRLIAALLLLAAPAAAQAQSETMTAQICFRPRPSPPSAPTATSATGCTIEDPWHWLQGPELSEGRRPGRARLSARGECLFRSGDGAAPAADRQPVRGDEGPDQGGRQLGPGPRRRLALLVGVPARRAISDLVPAAGGGRRGRRSCSTSRPRPTGKQYFRLGAMRGQPGRALAATLVDDNGSERFKLRIRDLATRRGRRDGDRGRHRPRRSGPPTATPSSSPRSTTIGAAIAPGCTGSAGRPASDVTLYEETEDIGFTVGIGRSRRTGATSSSRPATTARTRSASSPPTIPRRRRC